MKLSVIEKSCNCTDILGDIGLVFNPPFSKSDSDKKTVKVHLGKTFSVTRTECRESITSNIFECHRCKVNGMLKMYACIIMTIGDYMNLMP